ncbi:MAG: hypothetical protein ABL985_10150 [Casimicrobium sp.]
MVLRLDFSCRGSFGSFGVAALVALTLAGCASPQRTNDPSGAVRRTVTELAALRPAAMNAALTSSVGERAVFDEEVAKLRAVLVLPPGPEADEKIPAALSAAVHFNVELDAVRVKLLALLPVSHEKPPAYQRGLLSVAHSLFAKEAAPLLPELLPKIRTPREFAIGAYTLLQTNNSAAQREWIAARMRENFANWETEPRLRALTRRLQFDPREDLATRPPLADLLAAPINAGYPVVFSFQRRTREHSGLALVRGADGRFVRNADGSYFNIAQLAMARTNLPGTITNGNTPQGVFVIRGTGTATNRWIGPTPYLESMLPVEAPIALFEKPELRDFVVDAAAEGARKLEWTDAQYARLLPMSWRDYFPMKEAFLAGHAGRDEILAHGNTVNPAYYRGERFFPYAPSAGCLVAMEYWSKDDGTLVHSDQLALVKAFVSGGSDVGFLVVVEVDDQQRAVVLADVIEAVVVAERGR